MITVIIRSQHIVTFIIIKATTELYLLDLSCWKINVCQVPKISTVTSKGAHNSPL